MLRPSVEHYRVVLIPTLHFFAAHTLDFLSELLLFTTKHFASLDMCPFFVHITSLWTSKQASTFVVLQIVQQKDFSIFRVLGFTIYAMIPVRSELTFTIFSQLQNYASEVRVRMIASLIIHKRTREPQQVCQLAAI